MLLLFLLFLLLLILLLMVLLMVLLVVSVHDMVGCVLYVNQNEGWMDGSLCVLTVLLFVVVIASRVAALHR